MKEVTKLCPHRLSNLLGYQVCRVMIARALMHWRRMWRVKSCCSNAKMLMEHGYIVIEQFLPREAFESVRREFELAIRHPMFITKRVVDSAGVLRTAATLHEYSKPFFPATTKHILENKKLLALIKDYDGQDSLDSCRCMLEVAFWRIEEAKTNSSCALKSDHTNCDLHSDSFQSLLKGFLYLNDVNECNGAHRYVPHSHRITVRRILFEYLNSILWLRDSPRIPKYLRAFLAKKETVIARQENSLIFEDTFGFHAASRPKSGYRRDIIYFQYRGNPFNV